METDRRRDVVRPRGNVIDAARALAKLRYRCRDVIRPRLLDWELDEELDAYLDLLTAEKMAAGMSAGDARRAAVAELGGRETIKGLVRSQRFRLPDGVVGAYGDARAALAPVARTAHAGAVLTMTLGLGISANIALLALQRSLVDTSTPAAHAVRSMASVTRPAAGATTASQSATHVAVNDSTLASLVRARMETAAASRRALLRAAAAERAAAERPTVSPNMVSPPD